MRIRDALRNARGHLAASGVDEPGFEAEYLLRHALGCTRASLLLGLDDPLAPTGSALFESLVERRASGEPSAYVTGRKEFYGLDFKVDPRALIPRPETELLVEAALDFAAQKAAHGEGMSIADVGVGCGAIAVALAMKLPKARIFATDVSPEALDLAHENAALHGVERRVTLLQGDLLTPLPQPIDILVSNPPYIPSGEVPCLAREIREREPLVALDGGPDGTALLQRLVEQAKDKLVPAAAMFVEIGWDHGQRITAHARRLWPDAQVSITPDLAGLDRVLTLRSPVAEVQPV